MTMLYGKLREKMRVQESEDYLRLLTMQFRIALSVKQQPVAYDVDAVVEQLKEQSYTEAQTVVRLKDAIEIVKDGGIEAKEELSKDDADLER